MAKKAVKAAGSGPQYDVVIEARVYPHGAEHSEQTLCGRKVVMDGRGLTAQERNGVDRELVALQGRLIDASDRHHGVTSAAR